MEDIIIDHSKGIRLFVDTLKSECEKRDIEWRQITHLYYKDYGINQYCYFDVPTGERIDVEWRDGDTIFLLIVRNDGETSYSMKGNLYHLDETVNIVIEKFTAIINATKVQFDIKRDNFHKYSESKDSVDVDVVEDGFITIVDYESGKIGKYSPTELVFTGKYDVVLGKKYIKLRLID